MTKPRMRNLERKNQKPNTRNTHFPKHYTHYQHMFSVHARTTCNIAVRTYATDAPTCMTVRSADFVVATPAKDKNTAIHAAILYYFSKSQCHTPRKTSKAGQHKVNVRQRCHDDALIGLNWRTPQKYSTHTHWSATTRTLNIKPNPPQRMAPIWYQFTSSGFSAVPSSGWNGTHFSLFRPIIRFRGQPTPRSIQYQKIIL